MRPISSPCASHTIMTLICLLLPLCCACLCGRSGRDRVEEDTRILTTATEGGRTATVTYERTNRRGKQHMDQLGQDRFYTTTESLSLTLDVPPDVSSYTLVVKSNREGEITMPDPKVALQISPDGERVAYKLGEDPWQLLFLMNEEEFIAAPPHLIAPTGPDWSTLPTLPGYTTSLYLHHTVMDSGQYSFIHRKLILAHIRKKQGEQALIDFLFLMEDHPQNKQVERVSFMNDGANMLSEQGQEALHARLVERTLQHDPPRLEDLNLMLSLVDVSSPLLTAHIQKLATAYTSQPQSSDAFRSEPAAMLLLEAARQDIALGHKLSCEMLTTHAPELARPGKEGWEMRLTALTVIATSGVSCPVLPSMISKDPCLYGYTNEQGAPLSKAAATRTVEEEFAKGPLGGFRHRPQLDGHFVLAALWMTGQPLPDSLKDLRCLPVIEP